MSTDKSQPQRANYFHFYELDTRWSDNDIYGHVNNVVYYSYFDSAVNRYLIEEGGLNIHAASIIGLVVSSHCHYHAALAYPDKLEAGLRVDRLGNSSVHYGVGIFKRGHHMASAHGQFVHVFVDRETRRPVSIPDPIRSALAALVKSD